MAGTPDWICGLYNALRVRPIVAKRERSLQQSVSVWIERWRNLGGSWRHDCGASWSLRPRGAAVGDPIADGVSSGMPRSRCIRVTTRMATRFGGIVDMPQRFGSQPYQQFDPGQSSSHRHSGWAPADHRQRGLGPLVEYPFILGNNAAGFPHAFLGTARPLPIFIGCAAKGDIRAFDQSDFRRLRSKFYSHEWKRVACASPAGLIATFNRADSRLESALALHS